MWKGGAYSRGGYFDGMGCRGEVGVCRVEREVVEGRRVHRGEGGVIKLCQK